MTCSRSSAYSSPYLPAALFFYSFRPILVMRDKSGFGALGEIEDPYRSRWCFSSALFFYLRSKLDLEEWLRLSLELGLLRFLALGRLPFCLSSPGPVTRILSITRTN